MAIILDAIDFIKPKNRAAAKRLAQENNQTLEVFALSVLDLHLDGSLVWVEDPADISTKPSTGGGKIEDLNLSTRPYNRLKDHGVDTIEDLCAFSNIEEIINIDGMGAGSAKNIMEKMDEFGLSFGMTFSDDTEDEGGEEVDEEGADAPLEASPPKRTKGDIDQQLEDWRRKKGYIDDDEDEEEASFTSDDDIFGTDDEGDDWDKEEALYEEIRKLNPSKEGVKRAYDIYKELNDYDEEEARSKLGKILVDYDKDDPRTFGKAIEAFHDHLPASREVVDTIISMGRGANIPEEDLNSYNGKVLSDLTMAEAKKKIASVRKEYQG